MPLNLYLFQHTAARRRLAARRGTYARPDGFNTQPPEGGWSALFSEYSQLKGFNTQPPEGGWSLRAARPCVSYRFNTQPPEGGWARTYRPTAFAYGVSTHSRPKAAGASVVYPLFYPVRFNTQPPEGGWL